MDPRVTEFQCIMPMVNISSVLAHGVLSHDRASKLAHASVAMEAIQEKRDKKYVPGGLKLHQYANLYFHARNPMLFKRKDQVEDLCILRISIEIGTWMAWFSRTAMPPGITCAFSIQHNGVCWPMTTSILWTGAIRTIQLRTIGTVRESALRFWSRSGWKSGF